MKKIKIFFNFFLLLSFLFIFLTFSIFNSKASMNQEILMFHKKSDYKQLNHIEGEIIVKFKDGVINLSSSRDNKDILSFNKINSLELKENIIEENISLLKIKDNKTVEEKIFELKDDPRIEFVQANFQYYPASINTNDTHRNKLWALYNYGQEVNGVTGTTGADISAIGAWNINEGTNATSIVAVIDTGVAYNHPDLKNNMWDGSNCKDENGNYLGDCIHGYAFNSNSQGPNPIPSWYNFYYSHGTHVAGTIAAIKDNEKGIIGVAPNAKIMAISTDLSSIGIYKSINFAKHNGAKIINASFGGSSSSCNNVFDPLMYGAIENFAESGGLFIAAAGNNATNHDGENFFFAPADYSQNIMGCWEALDNIISVAATDSDDNLASFSDYGENFVHIGAPGGSFYKNDILHGKSLIYSTVADSQIYFENFEDLTVPNIPSDWTKEGDNNWRSVESGLSGWGKVLYADYSNPYSNNANTSVISSAYDFSNASGGFYYLQFWTICQNEINPSEEWTDYMTIDFSNDNGETFEEILRWDERSLGGSGEGAFDLLSISIPEDFNVNNFKFKFRWTTNETDNNYMGCLIDDVLISKYSDGSDELYSYYNGTSMAAPHVSGLAALVWGYNPNLSYTQVRDIILSTGDDVASLSGKTITGKRINAEESLILAGEYSNKDITSFIFDGIATSTIDGTDISITVPYGTDVASLTPTIVHTGESINPESGVVQDFSNPVTYTVTAEDSSTKEYLVTVTVAPSPLKDIVSFIFDGIATSTIDGTDISITVPYGTDVASLTPTIVHTGQSISPESGVVQDFSNPVTYTVTAEDSSTKEYLVTVTVAPSPLKDITSFIFDGIATSTIDGTDISITVPYGTDVASLTPTIVHTGQSISPESGESQDFSDPVTYTVTAEDSSTKEYVVTVSVEDDPIEITFNNIYDQLNLADIRNNLDEVNSSNYEAFSDLFFEKSIDSIKMGSIRFSNPLDLSATSTIEFLGELNDFLDISEPGKISLNLSDSKAEAMQNASATIKFYALDILFPQGTSADEINDKLIAFDSDGNLIDINELVTDPGIYNSEENSFTIDVLHFTQYLIDNEAPDNQDVVFSESKFKQGGDLVDVISAEEIGGSIWFAPLGTTDFIFTDGETITTASGTSTSILAPTSEGEYRLYVIDLVGNISEPSLAKLTVDNTPPTINISEPSLSITNNLSVDFIINYEGANNISLSEGDITLNSTNTATGTISVSGAGTTTRTVTISDISGDGSLGISISENTASDLAGNLSLAAGPSQTFIVDNTLPTVETLGDGLIDYSIASSTFVELIFNKTVNEESRDLIENSLNNGTDQVIDFDWKEDYSILELTNNNDELIIFENDVMSLVSDLAGNQVVLLLINSALDDHQISADESGEASLDNDTPEVVVSNPILELNLDISADNPLINFSPLISSSGAGTIPAINISSSKANVFIPNNTLVSSEDPNWNGIMKAPTVTSVNLPPTTGQRKTLSMAIEIGFSGAKLSFDKAVKLVLPNQANKRVGFTREGMEFTEIINICGENSQSWADNNLDVDGNCKINSGSDLIIWTKHFTKFAAYTQTTVSSGSGSGGGGTPPTYCLSVEYGPWGACVGTVQSRQVINRSPSGCTLTTAQQLETTRECFIDDEDEKDDSEVSDPKDEEKVDPETPTASNELKKEVLKREKNNEAQVNNTLTNRLAGRILLQVEENGEAWYIEPETKERHFMGRPADAFSMMRKFGLGISEVNYNKFVSEGVPSRFAGRIFLRVEQNGEAYYVNPVDLEMHFLNRPADAFRIMRELALGITNDNLRQIPLALDELMAVCLIDNDLSLGMDSLEVLALQKYLNTTNFPIALEGIGSKGRETTMFRDLTEEALKKYQVYYNLSQTGIFDQETRDSLVCF